MKTVVITGASDGIGEASARRLKNKGHNVIIVGRSEEKTKNIAKELQAPFHIADFSRLSDVRRLASELKEYDHIDVLVNNAGGIMGERELTDDGFEKTFQVNHLSPFLLTYLLMEELTENNATVIQTSSVAANFFGKDFDVKNLNNEQNYTPEKAYGYSKLENILFTRELDKRYRSAGISAVAFHPGSVRSNFASETTSLMRFVYNTPLKYLMTISSEKSGQMLTNLVLGEPGIDWERGEMYSKGKPMKVDFQDDGQVANELWESSEQLLNLKD